MNNSELLTVVKTDLEIIGANETRDTYISNLIERAKAMISREGVTLDMNSVEDCGLVAMYAAWLYRKRAEDAPAMPRMIRWALNNRLFSEKVREE